MRSLDLYIFRQCLTPLAFAVIVTTAIVWMTQSLQRVDIVVEYGASVGVFAWLSVLIIPSLLAVIVPFALFAAALYALQRLHSDSEIAVIFAAGVSRWRIAAPLLLLAAFGAAATLWVNLDLMPRSYRALKHEVANIRADVAATVLKSGEFTTIADRMTIYVERTRPGGQFEGLLVNDYSDPERPATYMAQKGVIRETREGPVLYLANGNIQRPEVSGGHAESDLAQEPRLANDAIDIVNFTETALNVSTYTARSTPLQLELTERYLSELFHPDMNNPWDRENASKLIAEGHSRLSSPLYAFAYVMLALSALIGGAYSRRGYGVRIAIACAVAAGLRIAGFLALGVTSEAGLLQGAHWLHYAIPLAATGIFAAFMSGQLPALKRAQASGNIRDAQGAQSAEPA